MTGPRCASRASVTAAKAILRVTTVFRRRTTVTRPQAARRISAQCRIQPTTLQRISAGQVRFCQGRPEQQTTTNAQDAVRALLRRITQLTRWAGDGGGYAGGCGVQAAGGGGVATSTARRRCRPTQEYADIADTASRIGPSNWTEYRLGDS